MGVTMLLALLLTLQTTGATLRNMSTTGCHIIKPPRDGGIRYRGLSQEQIRRVQILPVDYEIEYICRGERIISGPKVRKCLENGSWTDMSKESRCLHPCPRVWLSLENGQVQSDLSELDHSPVEGTQLSYHCDPGFRLLGVNTSTCTKIGKWDSPKPVCQYDRHYTGQSHSVLPPLSECPAAISIATVGVARVPHTAVSISAASVATAGYRSGGGSTAAASVATVGVAIAAVPCTAVSICAASVTPAGCRMHF
ncbi:UNVERIFIED_CONTAM: hypothetical protein FKN15_000929 [Acipenser sinensis]